MSKLELRWDKFFSYPVWYTYPAANELVNSLRTGYLDHTDLLPWPDLRSYNQLLEDMFNDPALIATTMMWVFVEGGEMRRGKQGAFERYTALGGHLHAFDDITPEVVCASFDKYLLQMSIRGRF